jgi:hypothetical protein
MRKGARMMRAPPLPSNTMTPLTPKNYQECVLGSVDAYFQARHHLF